MEKLWPGTFVEEGNVTFNISVLRKALGEWENGDNFIKTVPKRGYRFIAPVQPVGAVPEPPPPVAAPSRPKGQFVSRPCRYPSPNSVSQVGGWRTGLRLPWLAPPWS